MQIDSQGKYMLIVSENGLGKRTDMEEFTCQHRGGKGVKLLIPLTARRIIIPSLVINITSFSSSTAFAPTTFPVFSNTGEDLSDLDELVHRALKDMEETEENGKEEE